MRPDVERGGRVRGSLTPPCVGIATKELSPLIDCNASAPKLTSAPPARRSAARYSSWEDGRQLLLSNLIFFYQQ
ncbi:hypothetical protein CBOM_01914 [Ceraceosorus bombacis]|uniref:Uncharacterized protein n=1 Tax=Ceraceosorus bombacis TaxID=401625 RepID=A0A0P1BF16_9BASI|nr:hypothetical protein CBOM_01914 [Ceraceosorus bombacis]